MFQTVAFTPCVSWCIFLVNLPVADAAYILIVMAVAAAAAVVVMVVMVVVAAAGVFNNSHIRTNNRH